MRRRHRDVAGLAERALLPPSGGGWAVWSSNMPWSPGAVWPGPGRTVPSARNRAGYAEPTRLAFGSVPCTWDPWAARHGMARRFARRPGPLAAAGATGPAASERL